MFGLDDNCYTAIRFVVIGLAILWAIHLVYKFMGHEGFESLSSINDNPVSMSQVPQHETVLSTQDDNVITGLSNKITEFVSGVGDVGRSLGGDMLMAHDGEPVTNPDGCTVCHTDMAVSDYVRHKLMLNEKCTANNYVYDENNYAVKCNAIQSAQQEIEQHNNEFINFNAGVFQSSNGEDVVDRINELYLSGNTDISRNHRNVRIRDLFDGLNENRGNMLSPTCHGNMEQLDSPLYQDAYTHRGYNPDMAKY